MKRILLPLALAAAITVPVGAQFGWFSLNGGLIARMSSATTAATIQQYGSGAVLDLYAGTTRIFRATSTAITSSIAAYFADGTAAAPSIAFANDTDTGFYKRAGDVVDFSAGGGGSVELRSDGVGLASTGAFQWFSGALGSTPDVILARDAANTLALRNGTNAQTFRVYGSATEYTAINQVGGALTIQSVNGSAKLQSTAEILFAPGNNTAWAIATTGHLVGQTATGGVGYGTGAGGAVTQITSKSTGVTLNTVTGNITMEAGSLAANTAVSFTLTDSAIEATDLVVVTHHSGGTAGAYTVVGQAAAGSAVITLRNVTGGALAEAVVLKFAVIKGAVS